MAFIRTGGTDKHFSLKSTTASNTISDCVIGREYLIIKAGIANETLAVTGGNYTNLGSVLLTGSTYQYFGSAIATATTMTLSGVGSSTSGLLVFEMV